MKRLFNNFNRKDITILNNLLIVILSLNKIMFLTSVLRLNKTIFSSCRSNLTMLFAVSTLRVSSVPLEQISWSTITLPNLTENNETDYRGMSSIKVDASIKFNYNSTYEHLPQRQKHYSCKILNMFPIKCLQLCK